MSHRSCRRTWRRQDSLDGISAQRPFPSPLAAHDGVALRGDTDSPTHETLIIFKSPKALAQFIDKGWEYGGGGAVQAGAAGKSAGAAEGVIPEAQYYTLTMNWLAWIAATMPAPFLPGSTSLGAIQHRIPFASSVAQAASAVGLSLLE